MAYQGNKFLFDSIIADENDNLAGMELLEERLQELSESSDPDRHLEFQKVNENGKNTFNVQLPCGADFHIENGKITFSKFGLSKEELKQIYSYLNTLSISGLHFDADEPEDFKETAREAQQELIGENGAYESGAFWADSFTNDNGQPTPANSNNPPVNAGMPSAQADGLSDEERIRLTRTIAGNLKQKVHSKPLPETPKKVHPCIGDINKYMEDHVKNTQKYKSNNYRKRSTANGWELMFYKDADQKKEGPTADKKGKVNPNFDFGLRGEIVKVGGQPRLKMTFMTPKYGDMADWMFDEVMNMADECKCTHIKFAAGFQHKSKFFAACGKKLIIPSGINLKVKDINAIYKAAQDNNDDPKKRTQFYIRFAEQLEEQMRKQGISDEAHPFVEWTKKLRDEARLEPEINKSKVKFKKFNQFFENNLMDRFFEDENDKQTAEPDAVKEIAGANAYVRFLTEFKKDDKLVGLTDEDKLKVFKEFYNEEVYLADKKIKEIMGDLYDKTDSASIERREKLLSNQFKVAGNKVRNLAKNIKQDLGVEVDTISLQESEYLPWVLDENGNKINPNKKRIAKGHIIHDRNMANSPMYMPRGRN